MGVAGSLGMVLCAGARIHPTLLVHRLRAVPGPRRGVGLESTQGAVQCGTVCKPGKYPIFWISLDTSNFPHFPTGYLDTNFFINDPVGKLVTFRKNAKNGTWKNAEVA